MAMKILIHRNFGQVALDISLHDSFNHMALHVSNLLLAEGSFAAELVDADLLNRCADAGTGIRVVDHMWIPLPEYASQVNITMNRVAYRIGLPLENLTYNVRFSQCMILRTEPKGSSRT